jgi:hypothetical protein
MSDDQSRSSASQFDQPQKAEPVYQGPRNEAESSRRDASHDDTGWASVHLTERERRERWPIG